MSLHPNREEIDMPTTAQLACQTGSNVFEGRIREMLSSHGANIGNQLLTSRPSATQQSPTGPRSPPSQVIPQPSQSPSDNSIPGVAASRSGNRSRGRSRKPNLQSQQDLRRYDSLPTISDHTEAPLPYSIKPARRSQRHQVPRSAQQRADIPNAAASTDQTPKQSPGQHPPTEQMQSGQQSHPDGPKIRRVRGNYQNSFAHPTLQSRAPFPSQTAFQLGHHPAQSMGSAYSRPVPRHQQLYNPHAGPPYSHQPAWLQRPGMNNFSNAQVVAQAQIAYLDAIAREEIPKVMISPDEEQQKETARTVLEDICQRVLTEHEMESDALFDGSTVSLKCYGSLRTGFATQSSDMDLALDSPKSEPTISSPDSAIPRLLEKALLDLGYGARLLTRTRVPLIRFCEKPTPELAARLHETRLRWEKERDFPPKAKKIKKAAGKKAKPPKSEDGKDQHQNTTQDGKTLGDEVSDSRQTDIVEENHDSDSKSSDSVHQVATSQHPEAGETKEERVIDAHDPSINVDSINLQQLSLADGGDPVEQPGSSRPPPEPPKERREEVLPDDELIRLYRLAMKEGWFEPAERTIIFNFVRAVERNHHVDEIAECRAQLLSLPDVLNRYRPPPEHQLDYPTEGVGVQCDIIFSNPLAVHNSTMLWCYNLSDARVKPMVLFIKAWARRRKINSPYHGTLSSYGYALMVLHYLVNVTNPPICLNLQTIDMAAEDSSPENMQVIEGYGVRFWRDEAEIQQWARAGRITADRHSTVGRLLRGFFQYFAVAHGGFSWGMDVLSLRTPGGIVSKSEKGWTAAKTEVSNPPAEGQRAQEIRQRYLFAIEDPFETNHNIARTVVHNGIVAIRDEFRRANRLIHEAGNGRVTEDLFAEAESKNDLNYRYFGPRPRPPGNKEAGQAAKGKGEQGGKGTVDVSKADGDLPAVDAGVGADELGGIALADGSGNEQGSMEV
ncbi:MAG: hypothetical protein Q9219_007121 [cf. Caloplaca sp. 3 TL-2023]